MTIANAAHRAEIFPPPMAEIEHAIKNIPGFEDTAHRVAQWLHQQVLENGASGRQLADSLHGTWFGHPLHPALTDLPLGAWVLSALLDAYAAATGSRGAAQAADLLIGIGCAAAVPTALAGIADYSTIEHTAASVGAMHGILNGSALTLYTLSLAARRAGNRGAGLLLSTLGLLALGGGAALGGDLVYRLGVGVNHAPSSSEPEEWQAVVALDDLAIGEMQRVTAGNEPALVYRDAEDVYAMSAVCNHAGGPLGQGKQDGNCIMCPWHQSVFDMRDGSVVHGPATMPQPRFEARIRNGQVELRRHPVDKDMTGLSSSLVSRAE